MIFQNFRLYRAIVKVTTRLDSVTKSLSCTDVPEGIRNNSRQPHLNRLQERFDMEADEEPPDSEVGEGANVLDVVPGAALAVDEIIKESLSGSDHPGTV